MQTVNKSGEKHVNGILIEGDVKQSAENQQSKARCTVFHGDPLTTGFINIGQSLPAPKNAKGYEYDTVWYDTQWIEAEKRENIFQDLLKQTIAKHPKLPTPVIETLIKTLMQCGNINQDGYYNCRVNKDLYIVDLVIQYQENENSRPVKYVLHGTDQDIMHAAFKFVRLELSRIETALDKEKQHAAYMSKTDASFEAIKDAPKFLAAFEAAGSTDKKRYWRELNAFSSEKREELVKKFKA